MHPFVLEFQFFVLRPQPVHIFIQLIVLGHLHRDCLLIALELDLDPLIARDLASELFLHLALATMGFLLDLGELALVTAHFLDKIVPLCFDFGELVCRSLQLFAASFRLLQLLIQSLTILVLLLKFGLRNSQVLHCLLFSFLFVTGQIL